MNKITSAKIDEIVPDNHNFNKGTEYGAHLMEKSFRKFGAGRSILIDKNNRVIAGNKSLQTAAEIGLEDVIVVETDGNQLVAVKRTDLDLDAATGREMALADNATGKENLEFDLPKIEEITADLDINPKEWGIDLESLDLQVEEGGDESGEDSGKCQIIIDFADEWEMNEAYMELKDRYSCRPVVK